MTQVPREPNERADVLGGAPVEGPDASMLDDLMAQAQQMIAAQAQAADREVEGTAGGGMVRIRATGAGRALQVAIAPEVVDPDDVPMLEDLVLAALHDLELRLEDIRRDAMGPLGELFGKG